MSNFDFLEGESELPQANYSNTYQVKFIIVGDSGVGKSNIIFRFAHNEFKGEIFPTLGLSYERKKLKYNNTDYLIQIWDTAGQEQYRSVAKIFYQNASVVILVYDITKQSSFDAIKNYWIKEIKKNIQDDASKNTFNFV